jgi:3-hydroxybutyryl-CoA dehydratase
MGLTVGQRFTWKRTFTDDDVRQFAEVSGDRGAHHVQLGPDGRVIVQGLLTATLPTKIGGDLSFMAREMTFEFVRPVFSGDAITTDVTILSVEPQGSREWASIEAVCRNQAGKEVLLVHIRGFVTMPDAARADPGGPGEQSE